MLKRCVAVLTAFFLFASIPAQAQNYVVKDGNGSPQTFASFLCGGVQCPKHVLVDSTGAPIPVALDSSVQATLTQLQAAVSQLQTLVALAQGTDPSLVTQSATSGISVQRTTGIGSTGTGTVVTVKDGVTSNTQSPTNSTLGVLVAPADTVNRRTVRNIGSVALEITNGPVAYGSGHPLPVGESYTFDASGRTTGALYIAAASAGGAVSVISF